MAQNSNDPRVIAYYRNQREQAEQQAARGNASAQAELGKIAAKLSEGTPQQRQVANMDRHLASGGAMDAAKPESVLNDPVALAPGLLMDGLGSLLTHPAAAARIAEHVADAVGPKIGSALARYFPDGDEGAASEMGRLASRAKPRVVGKAKVEDIPKRAGLNKSAPTRALPKGRASEREPGPIERAGRARIKRQNATIRSAKAAQGSRNTEPIAMRGGYKPGQKAEPFPDEAPRAAKARAKAREAASGVKTKTQKAAKEGTPRAKGTNPRAKMRAKAEGIQKGTNPRAEGTNPRARKRAKE